MNFKKHIYTAIVLIILVILTVTVRALIMTPSAKNQSNSININHTEEINQNNSSLLQPI